MPGLVSVKTPPASTPLRIFLPENSQCEGSRNGTPQVQRRMRSPSPSPSTSTSRARPSPDRSSGKKKTTPDKKVIDESSLDNPDLGPFLLKMARDTIASGDSPSKALDFAIRAARSFERCAGSETSLDLAMCLHVVAAIHCSLGQFEEAVPFLEQAIRVPDLEKGPDHALAMFSGYMQLGDTHSMLGQLDRSISAYQSGLKIQTDTLGESDPRVAETCR